MPRCLSFSKAKDWCLRSSVIKLGLRSSVTDLKDGTVMHCWVPKYRNDSKPDIVLIHGFGANALWQWGNIIPRMVRYFNVYVPDLVFFGDSFTTRPERSDSFQAECVMGVLEANSVKRFSLVGLSYGGFVGYSMAAKFKDRIDKVVICCSGVCLEDNDLRDGMFKVSDLEEASKILVPQTPEKLKQLISYGFHKPPMGLVPSCLLTDFIDAMCTEYVEEKRELIKAIPKDRKLSNICKITQPTLILWGDRDQIFPLELGHRLKGHLGDNAQLEVIKNAGHAFNYEKPKEYYSHLKAFLVDSHATAATNKQQNQK